MNKAGEDAGLKQFADHNRQSCKGMLVVISSPSGGGKSTVVKAVRERMGLEYSVSTTTRPPREDEKNGIHYNFISKEDFLGYIRDGLFIEWAEVHGHLYGTRREYVQEKLQCGKTILLDLDVQGALKIKEHFPGALLIFITPPSMGVLERRLRGRGTDSEEAIKQRLSRASFEMKQTGFYDYTLINEDIEKTVEAVRKIIEKGSAAKQEKPYDSAD